MPAKKSSTKREELLDAVVQAQQAYWDAERDLEVELGIEIDDVDDYSQESIESLLEKFGGDDDEA